MSRRVVITCDKCKRDIASYSGEKQVRVTEAIAEVERDMGTAARELSPTSTSWSFDLCAPCSIELKRWLRSGP